MAFSRTRSVVSWTFLGKSSPTRQGPPPASRSRDVARTTATAAFGRVVVFGDAFGDVALPSPGNVANPTHPSATVIRDATKSESYDAPRSKAICPSSAASMYPSIADALAAPVANRTRDPAGPTGASDPNDAGDAPSAPPPEMDAGASRTPSRSASRGAVSARYA
jgi:hypothetical protein